MSRFRWPALVVLSSLLCAAAVEAQYQVGPVGGSGGDRAETLACPHGSYIVGFTFRGGSYVDGIQLKCARRLSPNTVGPIFDGPSAFSHPNMNLWWGVEQRTKTVFCPTHHVFAGIKTQAGDFVDRINAIRCVRLGSSALAYPSVGLGGTGGTVSRPYCNGADYANQIDVRTGMWVDRLSLVCRAQ